MKRILTLFAVAATLFAVSCQKDDTAPSGKQSGEVDVTMKASLPQAIGTYAAKSAGSDKGGINNVDPDKYDLRYIMEVWTKGDAPAMVYRKVMCVKDWTTTSAVTFNARLLAKEYDFVFWADFVDQAADASDPTDKYYTTTTLDNIAFNGAYGISDDARDAYYGKQTVNLTNQGATIGGITLQRPFGKLRLISTDKPANTDASAPTSITVDYGGNAFHKAFNALSGVVCDAKAKHTGTLSCTASAESDTYLLAYDYILAASDLTSLDGVTVNITVGSETFTKTLPTIPISANKLTTVKGNFYTNEGTLTVDVEDAFSGQDEITVDGEIVTKTLEQINKAIAASAENVGKSVAVKLTESLAEDHAIISIPDEVTAEKTPEITITLSEGVAENKKLTIGKEDQGQAVNTNFNGTVNVIVPKAAVNNLGDLHILAPNAHVTINGKYNKVNALTSANTLVVEKGTVIETLTIEGGNAKLYGTATTVTNSGEGKIYLAIGPGSDRVDTAEPAASTQIKDIMALGWVNGIIFTEGRYPLNCNMGNSDYSGNTFYMVIDKPGFELIGDGDKDKTVLYGCEYTPNGQWGGQQLITVLSKDVTIENLTLMPKQECNKTVEVRNDNFTIRNCNIVPNTLASQTSADGGCLWLGKDDATVFSNMTVENCRFDNAGVSVRPGTTATIKNNTFKGVRAVEGWYSCIASRGLANLSGNTYNGVTTDKGKEALKAQGTGKIVSDNDNFPNTEGIFWIAADLESVVIVNGKEYHGWGKGLETVLIKAGTFMMGTDKNTVTEYQHQVTLTKDFYMSKYQITTTQYAEFLNDVGVKENGVCPATNEYAAAKYPGQVLVKENGVNYAGYEIGVLWDNANSCWKPAAGYENNPVVYVSWYGAYEYAHWAGGSLPSESQWEYAYRAGTTTKYFCGDTDEKLGDYAWYVASRPPSGSPNRKTQAVGTKLPNPWKLYDMGGNTYEWTLYRYHEEYGSSKNAMDAGLTDPGNGNATGGSWAVRSCDFKTDSDKLRSAYRYYSMHRDTFNQMIGFRVVFGPGADREFFPAVGN